MENYHVPAVLGWGRPVSDQQATLAENMIYHELSRGKTLVEAIQRARYQLITRFSSTRNPAWPLLRLFSSGESLAALVTKGQETPIKPRRMKHIYLKQSRVQVLEEGFVGRRRQLQQSLRILKHDNDKIGVLLHGTGGLGKSCLAGKLCERFKRHHLIIVHGVLNTITLEAALKDAFINAQDESGEKILVEKTEMSDKLARLCASSFKVKHYLLLFDDFEQNLEGAEKGQPEGLMPETAQLLYVLLHYLPFSGKRTQLLITSRFRFALTHQGRDLVSERLETVCLTSFSLAEQQKKARELDHILSYPEQFLVPRLLVAGHGNPRLMEWLDLLVGQMANAEVPQLLEAVEDKKEEFIRKHVIRELLRQGGKEFSRFLCWLSIYRQPVLKEGVQVVGEHAGLAQWQELLCQGMDISLVEHDQARLSYGVTPLLREELLSELENLQPCHRAGFDYYKKVCKTQDRFDPLQVEEWIFHALGCGEEDVAYALGGLLVTHLRERLAFRESRRVGEWIMEQKKQALSTIHDVLLLNALAYTLHELGEHGKAIEYWVQALAICRNVYGEKHQDVATLLNNLGEAWRALGDHRNAIDYNEQALVIDEVVFGKKHPNVARDLNNLGSSWYALGNHHKAINYYESALDIWKSVYGEKHPQVATGLNNLGVAWNALGEPRKAICYHEQSLAIDEEVSGKEHPNVARDLNNLGAVYFKLGQKKKSKAYCEQAYAILKKFFGDEHPHTKIVKEGLKACK